MARGGGDKILLRGLRFFGKHGVLDAERRLGQMFHVDVSISADLRQAGASDELAHTVDYARVFGIVRDAVEGKPMKLVESVAERIAAEVLRSQRCAEEVRVRVTKPNVALAGQLDAVGVEISRSRNDAQ